MTDTTPLTHTQLAEIETRHKAATKGPWGSHRDLNGMYTIQARPRVTSAGMDTDGDIATLAADRPDAESYANARFIAHAPADVRALLDENRRLRAQRKYLIDQLAKKDAESGAGDRALAAFLSGEPESGSRPCGHDDYHDGHPWHDRPDVWCPGHSFESDAAASG